MPEILYKTAEGCERCEWDTAVPHFNCLNGGRSIGHKAAHCTADACY